MRLIVARCDVTYTGRATTHLPEAVRLLMIKADGTFMIWSDGGGSKVKPQNWMTAPTVVEDEGDRLVVRKPKTEDVLEIRLVEVLSDVVHDMGESAALQKDGVERHLQEELAAAPSALGEDLTLVKREWATDVGPVDLMCKDADGEWVAAAQTIKPQAVALAESRGIRCVEVDLAILRGEREPDLTLFAA
jgi:RecB family endonuclease NucS